MLLISGFAQRFRCAGYVADWCLFCRDVQVFRLLEKRSYPHLYFIPLWFGKTVGHRQVCEACKVSEEVEDSMYETVHRYLDVTPIELLEATNPDMEERLRERLLLEKALRDGRQILPEDRRRLLLEPFALIEHAAQYERVHGRMEPWRKTAFFLAILISCGMIAILGELTGGEEREDWIAYLGLAMAGCMIGALFLLCHSILTRFSRWLKRIARPALVNALWYLSPTPEELASIYAELRSRKQKVARWIKLKSVVKKLEKLHPGDMVDTNYPFRKLHDPKLPTH